MSATYQLYNSTGVDVTIDDLAAPATVPHGSTLDITAGNTLKGIVSSIMLREALREQKVFLMVGNQRVDLLRILATQTQKDMK